ncbi:DUF4244 domain-containing protein [Nonomuraea terrae]|uniref:DUF4244 domain-containing protein n=1 Tax=Nonomuraea terrae TaxID=2530383 RepID=UPI0037B1B511
MHSPATTPDDIKAAPADETHPTTSNDTMTLVPSTPETAEPTATDQPDHSSTSPSERSLPNRRDRPAITTRPRYNKWLHYASVNRERGMSTAEYAVGTIAACAFAAILFKVVSSTEVQEMLTSLIERALNTAQK